MRSGATLIGDSPKIIIGSAADLSFDDFVANLGPIILAILVVQSRRCRDPYRDLPRLSLGALSLGGRLLDA